MNSSKKLYIIYPLLFLLVISGMFAVRTDFSYAAESFVSSQGTRWVQGQNINSGLRVKTKGGTIAYCLSQGRAKAGGTYTDKLKLSSKLKAVLYYGYPNNKKFGSISLTKDQARCATQLAVWAHDSSGKGNQIDLDELHGAYDKKPDGDNVLKAAKWLYKKADSGYKAPVKPTFSAPAVTKPSNNTPQFYNGDYVRIGPYRYTTTSNSYTSNNKVTVDLKGAPAGTRLGNSSGSFISTPAAGTDFYLYLPSDKLIKKGSGKFSISASYDYKYEKEATFEAYKKSSTQDVAVSNKKEYAGGSKKTNAAGDFAWTNGKLTKVDSADKEKVIPDTEFEIYLDPTPADTSNDDWKFMYKMKTDENGIINIPGLGKGTYMLKETKPNPDFASQSEFGDSDEIIFKVTDVNAESVQIMNNNAINISCQLDKDTIKKTSAAYRSLPNQEGFDNIGIENYRYHVDYRSTANVFADEFTVDDPLEGVSAGQIRVTELWTPVSYGDNDGKMNIWYKTNKTDDDTNYSDVSALASNPSNPNNPDNEPVKKNTGYKLWKEGVSTTERTHLSVSDLGLDDDEYITALRLEHGRVEKGFTTRNSAYDSMNDDNTVDWTPGKEDQFYTDNSVHAEGLKPLTYLVMCPEQLSPPETISNSAVAFIARNVKLTDDDKDEVSTEVIDTFKENPINETYEEPGGADDEKGKTLGEFENPQIKEIVVTKTGDAIMLGALLLIMLSSAFIALALIKKNKSKMMSILLAGMIITGTFVSMDNTYAAGDPIRDSFIRNGLEYSLVDAEKTDTEKDKSIYEVEYKVDQNVNNEKIDGSDPEDVLPGKVEIRVHDFKGEISLENKSVKPIYLKKQSQIDKHEVIKDLDAEDISDLPESKVYTVRSDKAVGATEEKFLKRAGVTLKVTDRDEDGVPCKWDATIVYRGLESYLEKYQYNVQATYTGLLGASAGTQKVIKSTNTDEKDYNDLTEKEAEKRNEYLAIEKYLQFKGDEPIKKESPETHGLKTADMVKFLGLLAGLSIASFVVFTFLTRKKRKA